MNLHEILQGRGHLRPWEGPSEACSVEYRFDVFTRVVQSPGLPPLAGNMSGAGEIRASDGSPIPEGVYQLVADDGETLRVKKLGSQWVVLSS
jgi:hypothetical protein